MNKFLLILLATLLLTLTVKLVFVPSQSERPNILKSASTHLPILNYELRMEIDSIEDIKSHDNYEEHMFLEVDVKAKIVPKYNAQTNTFTVNVDYDLIDIVQNKIHVNEQEVQMHYEQDEEEEFEVFYQVVVAADSGEIISMKKISESNDEMVDQITKNFIKLIFPDIRSTQYNGAQLLRSAPEDADFGKVVPHFELKDLDNVEVLEKSYTEEDIVENKYDMGGEKAIIDYSEQSFFEKNTGLTKFSFQRYSVQMKNKQQLTYNMQGEDDGEFEYDLMGDVQVFVDSTLMLHDVKYDDGYMDDVNHYLEEDEFAPVDVKKDDGEMFINDKTNEEPEVYVNDAADGEEFLLTQGAAIHRKDYDIFKKKVLGQTAQFQVKYNNYGEQSNIQANIMVNSRTLKRLVDITYKHCGGTKLKNFNKQYNMKIFQVRYPILAIITITVRADISLSYGYNFYYGSTNRNHGCKLTFEPYFKPGLEVSGGASIAVAKGGIYARGTFANAYLKFTAGLTGYPPNLRGNVDLNVVLKPFEFDIGAWYQHIKCNLKKLFRWKPKFRKVCSMSSKKYITIIKGGVKKTYNKRIFNWNWKK